mmetsp:Transcript_47971/g.153064  ORF Transcript_47971/g.153064 Transcript_47971/m.153064 type:complete len:221 (-) Transcript_47971:69-731(-)
MPQVPTSDEISAYAKCISDLRVDNFGGVGTRFLLSAIGIENLPPECVERAVKQFPQLGPKTPSQEGPSQFKIYCLAEYDIAGGLSPSHGSLLRENGLHAPCSARPRWLRAVPLPINMFVERELCAEFQLLEAVCEVFAAGAATASGCCNEAARSQVAGSLRLLVTSTSCASCVGVLRQFQLLWPSIRIAVGMMHKGGAAPGTRSVAFPLRPCHLPARQAG